MLHALHLLNTSPSDVFVRAVLHGRITIMDAQNLAAGLLPPLDARMRLYRDCHARLLARQPGIDAAVRSIEALEVELDAMPEEIRDAYVQGQLTLVQARYAHRLDHLRGEAFAKFVARARAKATKALDSIPPEPELEPVNEEERQRLLAQIAAINPAHAATAKVLREGSATLAAIRGYHSTVVASHPS